MAGILNDLDCLNGCYIIRRPSGSRATARDGRVIVGVFCNLLEWSLRTFGPVGSCGPSSGRSPRSLWRSSPPCGRPTAASGSVPWPAASQATRIHGKGAAGERLHHSSMCRERVNWRLRVLTNQQRHTYTEDDHSSCQESTGHQPIRPQ